ncbi:hypothetical protein E2C01_023103 [Portunus trituberculatus]|uniref:Uncharacterized protein n=1 Tax=Portunus trituberculatus TaxID=210409 RepID=A0A5B7E759_PORTR|nr:hypothetical protein [Portunus trituberculatus]
MQTRPQSLGTLYGSKQNYIEAVLLQFLRECAIFRRYCNTCLSLKQEHRERLVGARSCLLASCAGGVWRRAQCDGTGLGPRDHSDHRHQTP